MANEMGFKALKSSANIQNGIIFNYFGIETLSCVYHS